MCLVSLVTPKYQQREDTTDATFTRNLQEMISDNQTLKKPLQTEVVGLNDPTEVRNSVIGG